MSFLTSLFTSRPQAPKCTGDGSRLLRARRAVTDEKYTARPADMFPSILVSREELAAARAEAEVLDSLFKQYKREARCQISAAKGGKLRRCEGEGCAQWTCNACRFHWSYRMVCGPRPLLFADEVHLPPGCKDHSLRAGDKHMQTLQIRLRDHEHPYAGALARQFAQRWHGYCHACLPRVSASLVRQLDGRFEACECDRGDAAKRYRGRWLCAGCYEEGCRNFERAFEEKKCRGRGCGVTLKHVGWEGFQPVCDWCLKIVDARGIEVAREAWREGEGFESMRKDSSRS